MGNLGKHIYNLQKVIFHREAVKHGEDGISYEISAGHYDPYPRPQMDCHWNPPVEALPFDRTVTNVRGFRKLIKRIGVWKKSA